MLAEGYTLMEAGDELSVSCRTIRKRRETGDLSPLEHQSHEARSKLDPYRGLVAEMLEMDRNYHHKKRHTAKRVYERLRDEHAFDVSYSTVRPT